MNKKVVLLINELSVNATPDELDVLTQAEAIEKELLNLGYFTDRIFMNLDMESVKQKLNNASPDFVFNLVESLNNSGRLIYFAPALLEHLGFGFSGSGAEAMFITSNKMLAKSLMEQAGLPTPEWISSDKIQLLNANKQYIAKPVWEDASVGITDDSVVNGNRNSIETFLKTHSNMPYFFEEYIDGREFNISILGGNEGPKVLPMAEIVFENYPQGKPKIVGYDAKWDEESFEYLNTVRKFGVEQTDPELAAKMNRICINCWQQFNLKGYVRVDFRVDKKGNPKILEINANPCLSPDAGFYAASQQAGLSFTKVIERICEDVWK